MFSPMDLKQVLDYQEALRREADQRRLAAATHAKEHQSSRAHRALRIRPSFAA